MKTCEHCGAEFSGKRRDARFCTVKCRSASHAAAHRDYNRSYYYRDRENQLRRGKLWREANPEKYKASRRKSEEKHREKKAIRVREWKEANQEHVRDYNRARARALGSVATAFHIAHVVQNLKEGGSL